MALSQIAYVSEMHGSCDSEELAHLMACARRNNVRDGITGILLTGRSGFIQVFEGPPGAVVSLFDRLENDPRHANIVLLHRGDSHIRVFPDTPMCLRHADPDSLRRLEHALPTLSSGLCCKLTAEVAGLA